MRFHLCVPFSEKHHSSALLLVCDDFHLAVDCPDMYRGFLRSASAAAGDRARGGARSAPVTMKFAMRSTR